MESHADVLAYCKQLLQPLSTHNSPGQAHRQLGYPLAHYHPKVSTFEAYSRPLWGLIPACTSPHTELNLDHAIQGLKNGTHPDHPEFWGIPGDHDQRLVEMAPLGLLLAMHPETIKTHCTPQELQRIIHHLQYVYTTQPVDNNWLYFRILVHVGLTRLGVDPQPNQALIERTFARLEDFYLGDGWYSDGPTTKVDYYTSMGFHYYNLIYTHYMHDHDPQRCNVFKHRAIQYARQYAKWFTRNGSALPFGRSLTYRFAQGAFWGALAFAGVEALPWGVIKGLYLRHLKHWQQQPILDHQGILTVGYHYPNQTTAEQYNSAGSPYWAMKAFLPLALPETHPFWQAKPQPYPDWEGNHLQSQAGFLLNRNPKTDHTIAFSIKQHDTWVRHAPEKYAKFCYSSHFGFSVPSGRYGLEQHPIDSMLGFSTDHLTYEIREQPESAQCHPDHLHTHWSTRNGAQVETWLVPLEHWHIRIHRVKNNVPMWTAEGAFALENDVLIHITQHPNEIHMHTTDLVCIKDLTGSRTPQIIQPHPNTNLMHPRTLLPVLTGHLPPGTHWLVTAVYGQPQSESAPPCPKVNFTPQGFTVEDQDRTITIQHTHLI